MYEKYYDTKVKRSESRCGFACKRIFDLLTCQKYEQVAIFKRNMSGLRIFGGLRECKARDNLVSKGSKYLLTPTSYYG